MCARGRHTVTVPARTFRDWSYPVNRLGEKAEEAAAEFLRQQGLTVIERNFQCRFGEIDIIAMDGETIVFVEVRKRASNAFGGAAASITPSKQRKLVQSAQVYLQSRRSNVSCRFDALLIEGREEHMEWIRNAFCT